ncbi:hypothetical protein [Mariprofundus ferrooxydans]|uniref:Uncharacterized protein n=1 Tax=Mariprofundus ferrooxydans PV-1 TaxID=314345 RepID=Q0EWB8_9PROT|nr:hypothetical protein [Mariprofundus ferrooxydans]EAU53553.1 hypothetical protein SPV1_02908 [Mariprofundus ferrooxydans PV-1]KON46999.1 hypothetical protein AL013_10425 [Mariprofundus ferrooxydans]
MTKLTCPSCGCSGDEELFGADMEWRRALMIALQLPSDCGPLVGRYVKLFAPLKRNLSSARSRKLLDEVSELVLAESIAFDRASYHIPSNIWAQSLQIMLDKPDLQRPIANHNYLIKVAIGQLSKRADIDQTERYEVRRNSEPSRTTSAGMQAISKALDPELPEIPGAEREDWLYKARSDLVGKGMNEKFIIAPLIEQRAREMYQEAQNGI